ncbi:MAG: ankyrin repeat domain-containing protein, partial [Gemmatimonadetes bacterium]|nr:ankyrin repeat domain-containing protein [Gemmatimonadota bacterium]
LLAGGAKTDARDWAGTTPLHDAARWRDLAIVTALIEGGADPNARDANGRTPLHRALGNSDPAVARALLASGADPLARDERGIIADPAHCEHWNTRWFAAAATLETMARCIESGADLHARFRSFHRYAPFKGNTPLHHAAMYEDGANAALLVEAGAGVGALNERGETPLIVAASHGRVGPAAVLLDGRADANARDAESRAVLHHAVFGGSPEVVALLLEAGADVHARDDNGATPLILPKWQVRHLHATLSEPAVVDLLIGAGADAKARDDDGWTALHAVASNPDAPNALQVAKRLLESGADPSARDYWGGTPLPLALAVRGDTRLSSAPSSEPELTWRPGDAVNPPCMRRPGRAPTPAC